MERTAARCAASFRRMEACFPMSFLSTRGGSCVTASQAVLRGLAPDGGLFVPAMFPVMNSGKIADLSQMTYPERALKILKLYLEDFSIPEISGAVAAAYGPDRFDDPAVDLGAGALPRADPGLQGYGPAASSPSHDSQRPEER